MNPLTATERALDLVPVLRRILLALDIRTLLVSAQRVCLAWNQYIRFTPALQKKLFFRGDLNIETQINPLLVEAFPFCFPHLIGATTDDPLRVISRQKDVWALDAVPFPAIHRIRRNRDAFRRLDTSWRVMLVRQPPPDGIGSVWTGKNFASDVSERLTLLDPQHGATPPPVRMPNLLSDVLLRGIDTFRGCPEDATLVGFRVIWEPVPSDWKNTPIWEAIKEELARYGVVVNNVICAEVQSPIVEDVRLLCNILFGPRRILALKDDSDDEE
ncbi:hypothetical protein HD806DRAFT_335727 [Xylariaceae sp. AK1471]|nr:hypothetical protein HD806DRAFT_335727 [Xylariaceae sp. AK1471]